MSGEAANHGSQRISHSSTAWNAGGLNFRVRNGYGCVPTALAASMSTFGIEPNSRASVDGPARGAADRVIRAIQLPPELMRAWKPVNRMTVGLVC